MPVGHQRQRALMLHVVQCDVRLRMIVRKRMMAAGNTAQVIDGNAAIAIGP